MNASTPYFNVKPCNTKNNNIFISITNIFTQSQPTRIAQVCPTGQNTTHPLHPPPLRPPPARAETFTNNISDGLTESDTQPSSGGVKLWIICRPGSFSFVLDPEKRKAMRDYSKVIEKEKRFLMQPQTYLHSQIYADSCSCTSLNPIRSYNLSPRRHITEYNMFHHSYNIVLSDADKITRSSLSLHFFFFLFFCFNPSLRPRYPPLGNHLQCPCSHPNPTIFDTTFENSALHPLCRRSIRRYKIFAYIRKTSGSIHPVSHVGNRSAKKLNM